MAELDPALGTSRYTPTTIDHFQHPRNVGRMLDADALATVDDAASETTISLYVKLEGGRIGQASFRTLGCSACVASSSIATELLRGLAVEELEQVDAAALDRALGGLPPEKRYCVDMVATTVRRLAAALRG